MSQPKAKTSELVQPGPLAKLLIFDQMPIYCIYNQANFGQKNSLQKEWKCQVRELWIMLPNNCTHPGMERLEGAFNVAFRANGGKVKAVATGAGGQLEVFGSVDEVGSCAMARRRLDDEGLVFKYDEASAQTTAQLWQRCFQA